MNPSNRNPAGFRHYRWVVCALLFYATTVNYIDRQILSLIKEFLDKDIGWTNEQFGWVNAAFQIAYGAGLLGFGWFIEDRHGHRCIQHDGSWQGFETAIDRYVDDHLTVVALTNLAGAKPGEITQHVAEMYLAEK